MSEHQACDAEVPANDIELGILRPHLIELQLKDELSPLDRKDVPTLDTEESIRVVDVYSDNKDDILEDKRPLEIDFEVEDIKCCTWTVVLRPFLALVHLALSIGVFLVLFVPSVFVLVSKVVLVVCKLKSSVPPEPSKRKEGVPRIFFDGAGWAFAFEVGVCKYIHEQFDVAQKCEVFAISAGNVSAICLLLDKDPSLLLRTHYPRLWKSMVCAHLREPLFGFCNRLHPIRLLMEDLLPPDFYKQVSGRYHIAICSWPLLSMRFVSEFSSNDELIDAVVASMALPGFVAMPILSWHKGWRGLWIDGGVEHLATPMEPLVDVAVRTILDPLGRFHDRDIHPPSGSISLKHFARPQSQIEVVELLNVGYNVAMGHELLHVLKPHQRHVSLFTFVKNP
mmetsp:Transcript_5859/g.20697  ORF Transcript_5859/g.20697 Transcript_5859/m.20697 type:complete len:395 (-) Transcript_5859:1290-2474(-)